MEDQLGPTDSQPASRPRDPLADYRLTPDEIAGSRAAQAQTITPIDIAAVMSGQHTAPQQVPPTPSGVMPGVWPPSPDGFSPATPEDILGLPAAPYHSPLSQSRILIGLLAGNIAISWITAALANSPTRTEAQIQAVTALTGLLFLATAIFFAVFTNRLYKNLAGFNAGGLNSSFSMAGFWFFIPFLNLYRPHRVYQDIWQASDPQIRLFDSYAWKSTQQSALVSNWWGCFLLRNLVSRIFDRIGDPIVGLEVGAVTTTIAGALAIAVVNAVSTRQEAKQNILEQSRAAMGVPYTPPM